MKRFRGDSSAIVVGAVAGAVLMALVVTLVFGLNTGVLGAVLAVLLVAVAAMSGWLVGMRYRVKEINYTSWHKGYQEGLAKRTMIFEHPYCRCSVVLSDKCEV